MHNLTSEQIINVENWIVALRSGKYSQGKVYLCSITKDMKSIEHKSYCCLGVACETLEIRGSPIDHNGYNVLDYSPKSDHKSVSDLPYQARDMLGLRDTMGICNCEALYRMNDFGNKTFNEIADFIEKNLKTNKDGLFV